MGNLERAGEPGRAEGSDVTIFVYGTSWCGDCHRARQVLDAEKASYTWVDIEDMPGAAAIVMHINGGNRSVPTILFPDGSVLVEPSSRELRTKLADLAARRQTDD